MTWIVRPAPTGAKCFDMLSPFTESQAKALAAHFEGCGLYCEAVTPETLEACKAAGLFVWWILEGLAGSTEPTSSLGKSIAERGVERVLGMGSPPGVSCFADIENPGWDAGAWIEFANAAALEITQQTMLPGGYFGYGCGLTAEQMYALRLVRYWRGASAGIARPACDFCAIQWAIEVSHPCGLKIDIDSLGPDNRGRPVSVMQWAP